MTKLLIVEDSKTYNNTLLALLRNQEYQIFQAFTLTEAKNILKKHPDIHYILLDLVLPDGEGDELIMDLMSNDSIHAKIIVLSGNKDIQRRNYLFEHGVVDYFSKDIPLKTLVTDIKKVIEKLSLNQEKNILVVDDSTFVLKSIQDILNKKNYNIITAKDGLLGLEALEKNPKIDLIFLDLEMPKMNGITFLEKIKNNSLYKDIPVLVLSSSNSRENYSRVLKHGAIDFIKKPFLTEEILLKADIHTSHADHIRQISEQAQELKEYKRVLNESDIISKGDAQGKITYVNENFCKISGYSAEFLMGKPHSIVRHPDMPTKIFKEMWEKIHAHKTFKGILKNQRRDGSAYYVDATISPIIDIYGNIKEIIGIRHDITDVMNPRKQLMADLSYLENPILIFLEIANYDLFKEFYSETIMHTFEFELEQVILNYFPSNFHVKKVYNLGNGRFGFLKNKNKSAEQIIDSLQKVIHTFQEIGISFKENHYDVDICMSFANEGNHILDDAFIGLQHAIKYKIPIVHAKNFHRRAQIEARNKLKHVTLIKDALNDQGEFVSYFQPIINNRTGQIEKYESLVRLIDKEGNLLSPFHFLDIAKKTGYYTNITEIILNNSFKALQYTNKDITINLSSSDIENEQLREHILNLITKKEHKGRITFELLEDEDIKDFNLVKNFIMESKLKGQVKIAIDDFGSGYSNYERLLEFQPDILKIDGSLIKNIVDDKYSLHVVESIIHFAKKQNIQTIAEFVANEAILNKIKSLGIDYSQGFYLGEPQKLF